MSAQSTGIRATSTPGTGKERLAVARAEALSAPAQGWDDCPLFEAGERGRAAGVWAAAVSA